MPIAEDKALTILEELIRKPETKAEDIPRIWQEIISVYNTTFAPAEPPKKKRRRTGNPNLGWPAGVSRAEFKLWKEGQIAKGVTEGLNPQEYKRLKEEGLLAPVAKAPAKAEAPKAEAKPKRAKKA